MFVLYIGSVDLVIFPSSKHLPEDDHKRWLKHFAGLQRIKRNQFTHFLYICWFILIVKDQHWSWCVKWKRHHIFSHSIPAALSKFVRNSDDYKRIRLRMDGRTDTSTYSKWTATQITLQAKFENCELSHWWYDAGWGPSIFVSRSILRLGKGKWWARPTDHAPPAPSPIPVQMETRRRIGNESSERKFEQMFGVDVTGVAHYRVPKFYKVGNVIKSRPTRCNK
jgi:hypothetical protein